MNILFVLIIISLVVASGFLVAFLWAVKSGQFEDDYTPSIRMLHDDELIANQSKPKNSIQKKDITNQS